jgi:starch synthase
MYSLRYGTLPLVHRVGGLADTVVDAEAGAAANGFVFTEPSASALGATLARALQCYKDQHTGEDGAQLAWRRLQLRGMSQDFSWRGSAQAYQRLYEEALQARSAQLSG